MNIPLRFPDEVDPQTASNTGAGQSNGKDAIIMGLAYEFAHHKGKIILHLNGVDSLQGLLGVVGSLFNRNKG